MNFLDFILKFLENIIIIDIKERDNYEKSDKRVKTKQRHYAS